MEVIVKRSAPRTKSVGCDHSSVIFLYFERIFRLRFFGRWRLTELLKIEALELLKVGPHDTHTHDVLLSVRIGMGMHAGGMHDRHVQYRTL